MSRPEANSDTTAQLPMRAPQTHNLRISQVARQLSTSMASMVPVAAPWRSTFVSHIESMKQANFTLSTLHPVEPSSTGSSLSFVPRARTVIYRGMWASLPVNPKNNAELNPDAYESDLVSLTTDARMEKIPELFKSSDSDVSLQSGRGGPVEAVFWPAETQTQWRLRGHAYVIGPDIDAPEAAPIRAELEKHMRAKADASSWSWSRELTAQFGNLSPGMRGSFRNPPPGRPRSEQPGEGLGLGQKVEDLNDKIARENFRVLVIVPEEVDRVDLSDPADQKRWNYKFAGSTETVGSWTTTELWP
ncbi:hypothetical protein HJFPF1_03311 [Paramyrothecium foliicola]|nr:hypothetical protein HJFPF1_03311 [Paramyrothecium foliicola]